MPPDAVVYLDLDGTLLGPGGDLLADERGNLCDEGPRALLELRAAGIPYVLVSGRSAPRLAEVQRLLGADGSLAELGALDAGYPTAPGQSVFAAIASGGIPAELLEREPELEVHPVSALGREGSHVLRGRVSAEAAHWVSERSDGALRLADNGQVADGDAHVYHLLPTAATKALSVERDIARRGVDSARCLAVGDSREDMAMAEVVGTCALVANGHRSDPGLAGLAHFVTTRGHGAGVREAIARWREQGP